MRIDVREVRYWFVDGRRNLVDRTLLVMPGWIRGQAWTWD
jgi:hypothetical protein